MNGRAILLKTKLLSPAYNSLYDGTQMRSLWIYLHHQMSGSACVSWVGPCAIPFQEMLDGEDLAQNATISSSLMVHFIAELFDTNLMAGVCFQRILADQVLNVIRLLAPDIQLQRRGDDLFWNEKKFSISIAAPAIRSTMVHFAVNVSNLGTPVLTCSLQDFKIDPELFATYVLQAIEQEWNDIISATYKVRQVESC